MSLQQQQLQKQHQKQRPNIQSDQTAYLLERSESNEEFEMTVQEENEVTNEIIRERNKEIGILAQEMAMLQGLFRECAALVFGQAEHIDKMEENITNAVNNVEEANNDLKQAEKYKKHDRGHIFDICLIVGGTGLGALGMLAGPWIGVPTLAAGVGLSSSIVIARNKIAKHLE